MNRLTSENDPVVKCTDPEKIIRAINNVMPELDPDSRRRLNEIKHGLLHKFGENGLFARAAGRHVSEILIENQGTSLGMPIDSGSVDGVSYRLYDSIEPESADDDHNELESDV